MSFTCPSKINLSSMFPRSPAAISPIKNELNIPFLVLNSGNKTNSTKINMLRVWIKAIFLVDRNVTPRCHMLLIPIIP